MTLREEITKSRADARDNVWKDMTDEEIDKIIDRIDKMGDRINKVESEVVNLQLRMDSVEFGIKHNYTPSEPPELIPGLSQDVLNDMVEVFKSTVAKKKQELAENR